MLHLLINDSIEELTGNDIKDFSAAKNIDDPNFTLADCLYAITLYAEQYAKDVYSYKPMYGGRWSTYLNDMNDRYMLKIIENTDFESDL